MSLRYWFSTLLVGGALQSVTPAQAQYLPLPVLQRALVTNTLQVDSVAKLLPATEWLFHPGESPYWTHYQVGPAATTTKLGKRMQARVELRRTNRQPYYDLIYKTSCRRAIARLRTGLRHQLSFQAEPVTCTQCEGERLVGYEYTITLINQRASYAAKRVVFPYVLVMRRTISGQQYDQESTEAISQILVEK